MMKTKYVLALMLVCLPGFCSSDLIRITNVEYGGCDNYKVLNINDHESVTIIYEGGRIPSNCRFGFFARGLTQDTSLDDMYEVCVEPISFVIRQCYLKVNLFFGLRSYKPTVSYSCGASPSRYCRTSKFMNNKHLDIEFFTMGSVSNLNASISLAVTATKKVDPASIIGPIVAGVVGGLLFIGIIALACIVRSSDKQSQGVDHQNKSYRNAGYEYNEANVPEKNLYNTLTSTAN